MARWKRTDPGAVPEELARYVESEWPGTDPIGAWRNACLEWLREVEGRRLPLDGDPGRRMPFGEYGDSVAVIRESARIKMELAHHA